MYATSRSPIASSRQRNAILIHKRRDETAAARLTVIKEINSWAMTMPKSPTEPRPDDRIIKPPPGIGLPLGGVGFIAGLMVWLFCFVDSPFGMFIVIAAAVLMGFVVPVFLLLMLNVIKLICFCVQYRKTGWRDHEQAMDRWRQEGDGLFAEAVAHDRLLYRYFQSWCRTGIEHPSEPYLSYG